MIPRVFLMNSTLHLDILQGFALELILCVQPEMEAPTINTNRKCDCMYLITLHNEGIASRQFQRETFQYSCDRSRFCCQLQVATTSFSHFVPLGANAISAHALLSLTYLQWL